MINKAYKLTFAARLKESRKMRGYTLRDVQEETGIPNGSLSQYENAKLEPSIDTIGTLSTLYEVDLNWLFGLGRQPSNGQAVVADRELSKQLEKEAKRQRRVEKQVGIFGNINGGNQYIGDTVNAEEDKSEDDNPSPEELLEIWELAKKLRAK